MRSLSAWQAVSCYGVISKDTCMMSLCRSKPRGFIRCIRSSASCFACCTGTGGCYNCVDDCWGRMFLHSYGCTHGSSHLGALHWIVHLSLYVFCQDFLQQLCDFLLREDIALHKGNFDRWTYIRPPALCASRSLHRLVSLRRTPRPLRIRASLSVSNFP